ncbi:MAG: hypothetical protein ABIF09_02045 [Gemmatimonadota bacterium]|nr:hypothetical protein [Longimicrobiales bacterium]
MGGINVGRWLAGGIAAAVVTFFMEGIASIFYMDQMMASLEALGLSMEMTGAAWFLAIMVSLISGLVLIFFYAAARPRFGPGPKTAILVAVALWFGGYLLSLIGYHMAGIYPASLLVMWGAVALVELIIAALVGGWVYREE